MTRFMRVEVRGLDAVRAGLEQVKAGVSGSLMAKGVQVGGRRTVPTVRANLAKNRQTGATSKSIGVKVMKFSNGQGAVGLVGPRRYHRLQHPAFGYRSRGLWRQDHPGTTDPAKIMHLIEGGRVAVRPKKAKVLAIVVARLRNRIQPPRKRSIAGGSIVVPGGFAQRLGKKPSKPKKVAGGFLIFRKFARAAKGTRPMKRSESAMASNAIAGVADTVRRELPLLAAKAAASGGTIFRG